MSRYSDDSRDRVRDAVDMIRLVESKVELRRAGHNSYFGCCPFHDERTASFHVRPEEKHYHCFGCSESGDPFDFVMGTEGLDFKGALESLADRFGVTLETVDEDPEAAARRLRRERLYSLLTRTASFYERMLWESREGERARRYLLDERGLDAAVLRSFRVGWAPMAWDKVLLGSRAAGFSDEEMDGAGLIQRSRKDRSKVFDRFRSQIMFPTADVRGRVIGFGARKLPGDDREWLGKYVNTAEGEIYSKRAVLYGISEARGPAAKAGRMVLAEGYTDVIALHQAGIVNAVGIMGTSLTKEQVAELVRLVGTLELCLDADNAGQEAMARAAALCAETGLELRVVALPPGADPGELMQSGAAEVLAEKVSASRPYVVFAVDRLLARADLSSAEGKDRAIAQLAPVMARVPQSVLRDELVRRIAGALELTDTRLVSLLEPAGAGMGVGGVTAAVSSPGPGRQPATPRRVPLEPGLRTERDFIAMCLAAGELGRAQLAAIDPDAQFTSGVLRRAVRRLTGQLELPAGGGQAAPLVTDAGQASSETAVEITEEQVSFAIDELESRARRAIAAKRTVGADELEHARLLLELARIERALVRARSAGEGVPAVAAERERVKQALSAVVARLGRSEDAARGF